MILNALEIQNFRNLGSQRLCFPPEGVAVIGENAQGKTNLLEAIYYLESFRSFRGASDGELTAFSQDVFHLKGEVEGDVPATVAAGYDRRRKLKKVTLNGSEALKLSAAFGRLGAVVFSPGDVELVSGGPGARRRFLDIVLSLSRPGYLEALQEYRRWLGQRNAALRSGGTESSSGWIGAWDGGLLDAGTRVMRMRSEWVAEWGSTFSERYRAIAGGKGTDGDSATLAYRPKIGLPSGANDPALATDPVALRERFATRLDESLDNDLRRGATSAGPHRDELLLSVATQERDLPLRHFGSGGQRRTAALALRLTEAATIRRRRGERPILLVDDAFAELDRGRSERVMSLLDGKLGGQVIVTAPKESDIRTPVRQLERWRIRDGVVEA